MALQHISSGAGLRTRHDLRSVSNADATSNMDNMPANYNENGCHQLNGAGDDARSG
jgi:hypothetical protein